MSVVLVIDDEEVVRDLMVEILQEAGYEAEAADTAEAGLERLDDDRISCVVSDIVMPGLSGLELLETVRARRASLPVVLVTGAGTYSNLQEAVSRGADGFIMKPFSHAELERAVATALDRAGRSEREVSDRYLTPTLASTLANAIEARDLGMEGHCERLAALSVLLACRRGLDAAQIEAVRLGAVLHDIGKISIPDRVLLKPGPLDAVETALVHTHPIVGDRLLEPLDLLANVRPIVRHHHERWDGSGYPDGLVGEEIPLPARIVAVADAVEAMAACRPYRGPAGQATVVEELQAGRGRQWDPALVDLALAAVASGEIRFEQEGLQIVSPDVPFEMRSVPTVLLVEDDPDHAWLAARAITSALGNVRVVHASDVNGALEAVSATDWSLAIVDQYLPDGRGLDLFHALRLQKPRAPIVMMTSDHSPSLAEEAHRRGASEYLVKSGNYLDVLTGRIRSLLEGAG